MRSCLIQVVVAAVVAFVLLWFVLPLVAGMIALNALNASGFSGTDTRVDVSANPPPMLLTGHADSLRVRSTNASLRDLHAGTLDITFGDVSFFSRKVGTVDGTLEEVLVETAGNDPISAGTVTVSGSAASSQATLVFSKAQAEQLASDRLRVQSGISGKVTFSAPDRWSVAAGPGSVSGTIVVRDGALIMRPSVPGVGDVTLIPPGDGNPFHLTAVVVGADSVRVEGTIDLGSLIGEAAVPASAKSTPTPEPTAEPTLAVEEESPAP